MKKSIDVIVGTHNRKTELINFIKHFNKIYKDTRLFIIDSSDNPLPKKYHKFCYKYIHDKNLKSLSKKRNLGLRLSKSQFIAFTDDDCIPDKNWLNELLIGFNDSKVMCVCGLTLPYRHYINSEYEKHYSFSKTGRKERTIKKKMIINLWRIGHGNNMAFRKEIFSKIGYFDENLGVGTNNLAGEDTDIFYRVLKNDYLIKYNPKAIIYHKHLVKKEDLPNIAYRNGFAIKSILFKHRDFTTLLLYFFIITKYFVKFLLTNSIINKNTLIGLVGLRTK